MEFTPAEELPENCPPPGAAAVKGESTFYRIVFHNPPTYQDFDSHRIIYKPSHPVLQKSDPCEACSCSIWTAQNYLAGHLSKKKKRIANGFKFVGKIEAEGAWIGQVRLNDASGPISDPQKSHVSWWRSTQFDVESQCSIL